jgi:hypothetical protein
LNSNMVTSHSVTLTNLSSFTLYSFQTKSVDRDGRSSLSSPFTFRTLR